MKLRKKSTFFRGFVLVVAFTMGVLCFPVNTLSSFAADSNTDYSFITMQLKDKNTLIVNKGGVFDIPKAYIGGDKTAEIGTTISGSLKDGATIDASSVTVSYNGIDVTNTDDPTKFTAANEGTYVITYSYTYTVDGETYTNSYNLNVESVLSSAAINFATNSQIIMPKVIDLNLLPKTDGKYKNIAIDLPTVKDEKGNEVVNKTAEGKEEDIKYYVLGDKPTNPKAGDNYVVISAYGGVDAGKQIDVKHNADNTAFWIEGALFEDSAYGAGIYTIRYSYYNGKDFVTSTTKEISVKDKSEEFYKNYKLEFDLSSEWTDNGETGVEKTLPAAKGLTSKDSKPASEEVDISYKVEVLFSSVSDSGFTTLDAEKYNKGEEDVVSVEKDSSGANHSYLKDPTKFKPLEDGYYRFVYTITDIYGNTVTSSASRYQYKGENGKGIKDEQAPTVVVYDAANAKDAEGELIDVTHKLVSKAQPNSVIVYAIGMKDNVSSMDDDIVLRRIIRTSENVEKATIEHYDNFNLIFNYAATDGVEAYQNLLTNNFYLRREIEAYEKEHADKTIASNKDMLDYLKSSYLIVVDNANIDKMYTMFKTVFDAADSTIKDAKTLKTWLVKQSETKEGRDAIAKLGFAYLDMDKTFGDNSSTSGMGAGTYNIYYYAEDAAGNKADAKYPQIEITTTRDEERPTITFPTALKQSYAKTAKITFDKPTVSDTQDKRLVGKVMYRFLNEGMTAVVPVADEDKNTISNNNLLQLKADIKGAMVDGEELETKYANFFTLDAAGYVDISDVNASNYTIDLNKADDTVAYVQIVAYVYDDAGNSTMIAKSAKVANATDKAAPELQNVVEMDGTYYQGDTIKLPVIEAVDDAVGFMSYEAELTVSKDGTTKVIGLENGYHDSDKEHTGVGSYYVHPGEFVASYSGNYTLKVKLIDGAGNSIVKFVNFEVLQRDIVNQPTFNIDLEKSKTLELDDFYLLSDEEKDQPVIDLTAPTVTYTIDNSVTYDEFKANKAKYDDKTSAEYKNTTRVIRGIDKDGNLDNYSVTRGNLLGLTVNEALDLGRNGKKEYSLAYNVKVLAYNFKEFEYNEREFTGTSYTKGGYFTHTEDGKTFEIYAEKDKFTFNKSGDANQYTVIKIGDEVEVYNADGDKLDSTGLLSASLTNIDFVDWFNQVKLYVFESENYNVTIQDTKAPVIVEQDYPTAIDSDKIGKDKPLKVYGMRNKGDASGIKEAKVELSWKLANGFSNKTEWSGEEAYKDHEFADFDSNNINGTYTVTYTIEDRQGNKATKVYEIAVGDNVPPTMAFVDDFVAEKYDIGTELKIDLSSIVVKDSNKPLDKIPEVSLRNTSTNTPVEENKNSSEDGLTKCYNLDDAGTYTLTFTVEDAVGNKTTKEFTFEVGAKTQDTTTVYKTVGTILIVVSVLVLAGVIVYFIVSKVKLDKELKK